MPRFDSHPDVTWPPTFHGVHPPGQLLPTGFGGVLVAVERVLAIGGDPERVLVVSEHQGHEYTGLIDCPKPDLLTELNRRVTVRIGAPLQELGALEVPHRGLDEIKQSGLWPPYGWCRDPQLTRRCAAIREVFMRIPPADWEDLKRLAGTFHWFIPRTTVYGGLLQCPIIQKSNETQPGYVSVLYLNPMLESQPPDFDFVIAVIVHEIAHLALGHRNPTGTSEDEKLEKAAWQQVTRWGFEKEARLHPKWPGDLEQDSAQPKSDGNGA